MKRTWIAVLVLMMFVPGSVAFEQEEITGEATAAIAPRLIRFSGALKDGRRSTRGARAVMHFALYASQEGGEALWKESQLVQLEEEGRYTVLLGASEKEGLPLELFSTEKAQWLGVQVEGQEEEGRVVLVAVPYALRAADADTVGGASASRFVLNEDLLEAGGDFNAYKAILMQRGIIDRDGKVVKQNLSTGVVGIVSTTEVVGQAPIIADTAIQDSSLTSYGYNAGTSGDWASYFGSSAGSLNTTGAGNSYFGWGSGKSNNTGNDNSFFGAGAGYYNTASNNSFFGQNAGFSNTTGNDNSFFGRYAGHFNTDGVRNTFIGGNAGYSNTTGYSNSFVGADAGYSNTTGIWNSFIGSAAGVFNTAGNYNSFFGGAAGLFNTTGNSNSFVGFDAGTFNTTGNSNSFVGAEAGYYNTTGNSNSFIGYSAGFSNTTGNDNSFFGRYAGHFNTDGVRNTFIGGNAGYSNTTGSYNSFIGYEAGSQNTTASDNVFIGHHAGMLNTEGDENVFVGNNAGYNNSTGWRNSFFGHGAGASNTTGGSNSFVGTYAGYLNTMGFSNSFVGYSAGYLNTVGYNNSFFGQNAGHSNTTGIWNSFIGSAAGYYNTTGKSNSFVGYSAGYSNTTEHNNSYLGSTSTGFAGITNGTAVGYRAQVTQSNSLVLGSINGVNGANADVKVGIGTTAPLTRLHVSVDGASDYVTLSAYNANLYDKGFLVRSARGSSSAPTITQPGDILFNLYAQGNDGTDYGVASGIRMAVDGTVSSGKVPGAMTFLTSDSSGTFAERMIINSSGNVGVGTTAPKERFEIQNGNILVGSPGQGIILKSPDGTKCLKLTVDNSGLLATTPQDCP